MFPFCLCLLSVEGVIRLSQPNRGMIQSLGSMGGSLEETVHSPTIFRPGRKCGVDIIFITSKQEESNE